MLPEVADFKALIVWLAKTHHGGSYYAMTKRLGLTTKLVYFWRDGVIKRPTDENIEKLCAAYSLDYWEVMRLFRRRGAAGIVVALLLAAATGAWAGPLAAVDTNSDKACYRNPMMLIGNWRRKGWWWIAVHTGCCGLTLMHLMFYRARHSTFAGGDAHRSTRPLCRPALAGSGA